MAILDVVLGLSFVYLVLSLACTAITELIEAALKTRANNLVRGVQVLLRDLSGKGLTEAVYGHPLIAGLSKKGGKPTYIPARSFALAFLDIVARKSSAAPTDGNPFASLDDLRRRVAAAPDLAPVRDALLALIDDARGDVERLRQSAEEWFNSAMDRAAGWYKRRTQWTVFAIGVALAVGLNADTIAIVRALSLDPKVRDAVVESAKGYLGTPATNPPAPVAPEPTPGVEFRKRISAPLAEVQKLGVLGLPVGWSFERGPRSLGLFLQTLFGWLLTAVAVSLGAPFWFDTLNKLVVVRSTVKPKEKSAEEASKDRTLKTAEPKEEKPKGT